MRQIRARQNSGGAERMNLLSCHTVADYFLLRVDIQAGDTISNLKLQKLCYYAQAWCLALRGRALFSERIEAWAHGPAIPVLYRRFRHYGWGAIDPQDLKTSPLDDLHGEEAEFLDDVWQNYSRYSGRQLELMTHREAPWKDAYGNRRRGLKCTEEITHQTMREFYGSKIKNAA
jgi:uncharacterized phage-associated protein